MQILATSHAPSGFPSLPSPTLTNPDMILPCDPQYPESSPSASRRAQRIPSPPTLNRSPSPDTAGADGDGAMKGAMRKFFHNGERSKLQKLNGVRGVESEHFLEKGSVPSHGTSESSVLASSPTLQEDFAANRTIDDEDGTIAVNGEAKGRASPFDDPAEFIDVGPPKYGFPPLDNEKDGFVAPPDIEDDDAYSHAAMSIRAEQILANAKKRLTNMEGNLNRARSTLHNRPSSSMSSFSNRSPDPVSLYTIPRTNISPSKHRQASSALSAANSKGHARIFSETSVPSSLHTPVQAHEQTIHTARASSALGSSSLNSPGEMSSDNSHNWFWTGLTRNTSHNNRHNYALPALEEDGPIPESFESSPKATDNIAEEANHDVPKVHSNPESTKDEDSLVVNHESPLVGLTRARSTTQMRDLRDQMQDLKGKISSLKQRAREDSMRRRSMQSLRTPSPFTAAEEWHGDDARLRQASPKLSNGSESRLAMGKHDSRGSDRTMDASQTVREVERPQSADEDIGGSEFELTPRNHVRLHMTSGNSKSMESMEGLTQPAKSNLTTDMSSEETSDIVETPDQGSYMPEEQDSLYGEQDYHEASPSPTGDRHEDRPDAFDYETFFLHSGTGTIAHKGHSRSSSHSSMYSVETTKPTYTLTDESSDLINGNDSSPAKTAVKRSTSRQNQRGHARSDSRESISTVATFATATEGNGSDGEGEEDEWILHQPMAGAWTNDQTTKRRNSPRSSEPPHDTTRTSSSRRGGPFRKIASHTNDIEPIPSVPSQYPEPGPLSPSSASLAVLSREAAQLPDADKKLVEMLVNSLSKVCARLKTTNATYEGRDWRRKLDQARRTLDGEMNGEVF